MMMIMCNVSIGKANSTRCFWQPSGRTLFPDFHIYPRPADRKLLRLLLLWEKNKLITRNNKLPYNPTGTHTHT